MELHTQHDLMLPVRARPLKNVAQMVEQRIVSSLLSWLPVKFNADNAGFYYQAISGNHNNQRHQRAIENAGKPAEIIKSACHQKSNNHECQWNYIGFLGNRFDSGRVTTRSSSVEQRTVSSPLSWLLYKSDR